MPAQVVVAADQVPAVELDCLRGELPHAALGEPGEDGVERLLLAHAGVEGLVAAEAGGDPERLAAQLAEPREGLQEELFVCHRVTDLERRVPRGQHRQVVGVELVDRLGVVSLELVLRYLVHPRAHDLAKKLATRLAPDRLRDDADRFLWLDEAEGHRGPLLPWESGDRNCAEGTWEGGRKSGPVGRGGATPARPRAARRDRPAEAPANPARPRPAHPLRTRSGPCPPGTARASRAGRPGSSRAAG